MAYLAIVAKNGFGDAFGDPAENKVVRENPGRLHQ
jgi:hypothetical protein